MAHKNEKLTVTQIAEMYGKSRMYTYKLVNEGKIPAEKTVTETNQQVWLANKADVEAYFANVKAGHTNAEGNNKHILMCTPEEAQKVADILAELNPAAKVGKAPTHANPQIRWIEPKVKVQ